jgi:2-polyprenyl-6-hydroxyphenyl methylase/3-demethylubiquinone-9 3-methyltransferase
MITENIDLSESDKFAEIAPQWWDENGPVWTLHRINPLRLKFIQDNAALQNKDVLDVGCGGGILSESMAKLGARVTGIDITEDLIDVAKMHAKSENVQVDYRHCDIEQYAEEKPGTFDVVTCLELLEHVPDPARLLQQCVQLCKPGAKIFVSTIHRRPLAYLGAILAAEYILNMLPKGTHDYKRFITPAELARYGRDAGMTLNKLAGINYNPISKNFSLGPKPTINYCACFTVEA